MICLAWAAAAGTMLVTGLRNESLIIDQRTTPAAFFQRGYWANGDQFALAAAAMATPPKFASMRVAEISSPRFRNVRFTVLIGIAVFGVFLALVASFLNPQNRFDVFTATASLGAIALALMAGGFFNDWTERLGLGLPCWCRILVRGVGTRMLVERDASPSVNGTTWPVFANTHGVRRDLFLMATATALFVQFVPGDVTSHNEMRLQTSLVGARWVRQWRPGVSRFR